MVTLNQPKCKIATSLLSVKVYLLFCIGPGGQLIVKHSLPFLLLPEMMATEGYHYELLTQTPLADTAAMPAISTARYLASAS